jgi:hypothetical protein
MKRWWSNRKLPTAPPQPPVPLSSKQRAKLQEFLNWTDDEKDELLQDDES